MMMSAWRTARIPDKNATLFSIRNVTLYTKYKEVPAENTEQDFKLDQGMKTEYNQEQKYKTVFHKKCHTTYKELKH